MFGALLRLPLLVAPVAALAGRIEDAVALLQAKVADSRHEPLYLALSSRRQPSSPGQRPPGLTVPLMNIGDAQYVTPVALGGQHVMASVETGYPEIAVIDRFAVDQDKIAKEAAAEALKAAAAEKATELELAAASLALARINGTEAGNSTTGGSANDTANSAEAANETFAAAGNTSGDAAGNATEAVDATPEVIDVPWAAAEMEGAQPAEELQNASRDALSVAKVREAEATDASAAEDANATASEAENATANSTGANATDFADIRISTNADIPPIEVDVVNYEPRQSRSFVQGTELQPGWATGNTRNQQAYDLLSISEEEKFKQVFWMVTEADPAIFQDASFTAILGLSPPEAPQILAWGDAKEKAQEVLDVNDDGLLATEEEIDEAESASVAATKTLIDKHILSSVSCEFFSVCLGAKPGSDGILVWNDTVLNGPASPFFQRLDVQGYASWSVQVEKARLLSGVVEPVALDACPGTEPCSALLESGSSLLTVPRDVVRMIVEMTSNLDSECNSFQALPSLSFMLSGKEVVLPPSAYLAKVMGKVPDHLLELMPHLDNTQRRCQVMLLGWTPESSKLPKWVLGAPFFRQYYTTFKVGSSKDGVRGRNIFITQHDGACVPGVKQAKSDDELKVVSAANIRLPAVVMAQLHPAKWQ